MTYSAPAPAPAPAPATPAPSYTPPAVVHTAPHHARHKTAKRHRRQHPKEAATKAIQPQPAAGPLPFAGGLVPAQRASASVTKEAQDPALLILLSGMGGALLLIVIVTWLPSTPLRATAAGRVAIDHQTDLLVAGIGAFLISLVVYVVAH